MCIYVFCAKWLSLKVGGVPPLKLQILITMVNEIIIEHREYTDELWEMVYKDIDTLKLTYDIKQEIG